ncbi:MAG: hypothetical protein NXI24_18840 [bacterium]|nr:hypothetical protein [bacterium]
MKPCAHEVFDGRVLRVSALLIVPLIAGIVIWPASLFAQIPLTAPPRGELVHDFSGEYESFIIRHGRSGSVRDVRDSQAIEQAWSLFPHPTPLPPFQDAAPIAPGDPAYNEALFRRAVSFYQRAREELADFRGELEALGALREDIRNPLWWKWIDTSDRYNRIERRVRDRYGLRLTRYFHETFATLDRIDQLPLARSERVLELRKRSYRLYAVNQVALGNFTQALKILERFAELPGVDQEWPLYYYLSECYAAEFRRARRNTGVTEYTLRELRRRKNLHRLRAVELKFGRASEEFREAFDMIRLEELGGPRSSPGL